MDVREPQHQVNYVKVQLVHRPLMVYSWDFFFILTLVMFTHPRMHAHTYPHMYAHVHFADIVPNRNYLPIVHNFIMGFYH